MLPPGDGADLTRLEHELQEGVRRRDRAVLEQLVAPEYTLVTPRMSLNQQQWIDLALSAFVLEAYWFEDIHVQIFETAAIVDIQLHQEASAYGQQAPADWRGTDIWIRRDGQWQIVKRCVFPIAQEPPIVRTRSGESR